jgi:hypothetical protein
MPKFCWSQTQTQQKKATELQLFLKAKHHLFGAAAADFNFFKE